MKRSPQVLIILDGFGYSAEQNTNAIYQARPTNYVSWLDSYPHTTLEAAGEAVGLLPGMIGNSEVGHLTIGAGRRCRQSVAELSHLIKEGTFFTDKVLVRRFNEVAGSAKRVHIMGLLSDAGVHSHIDHLKALIRLAAEKKVEQIIVHPFLDGRDVAPKTASLYLTELEEALKQLPQAIIGTLHGRFYAMDRDHRWQRTKESYLVLTRAQQPAHRSWQEALERSYSQNVPDEFFKPISLHQDAAIRRGDGLIFFNFRADRARQLTQALIEERFPHFQTRSLDLSWMITFTSYHPDFPVDVLLHKQTIQNTLCDVLEKQQIPLFTCAETEKYAHVTYFFNGGREVIHQNETRILIPSKRQFDSYAKIPEMSAKEITDSVLGALAKNNYGFYLINFANPDMVGHTGDFEATVAAIKYIDQELGRIYAKVVTELNGIVYITGDHGKAEEMWDNEVGQPRTAHTHNKVPFLYLTQNNLYGSEVSELKELANIAPFILKNLGIEAPDEMKNVTV